MKPAKLRPGNIYSGTKGGIAVFTNPTELARKKGSLKLSWPVDFRGRRFEDAEAAYQAFTIDCKDDYEACKKVCTEVLVAKLAQYPVLVETIKLSGGLKWIEKCSHIVGNRKTGRWVGYGLESDFIKCLYQAYVDVYTKLIKETVDNILQWMQSSNK